VEPVCYGSKRKLDLSGVKRSKGDYNQDDLAALVDKVELHGDIVEHWKEKGNNASTFCFAVNVEHSKHLAERFRAAGIPAIHVDGNTETDERDRAIAMLNDGRVKVLCNCAVFTEGTDVPRVKTIILARPTLSEGLYMQMAGRGARPWENAEFVILDHAGCVEEFGVPQMHRDYDLKGIVRKKREGGALKLVKTCPGCGGYEERGASVCKTCGHVFREELEEDKEIAETDEKLVILSEEQCGKLAKWKKIVKAWEWENFRRDALGARLLDGKWCKGEWFRQTGSWQLPKSAKVPKLTYEQRIENNYRRPPERQAAA
jgi:DNA repair protein RadD